MNFPKVILLSDEGIIISSLEDISKDNKFYKINNSNINFDEKNYNLLINSREKNFIAIRNNKGQYIFRPTESKEKYKEITYQEPEYMAEGSFGKVMKDSSRNIATKIFNVQHGRLDIPSDVIKEIAIYRMFSKNTCLPKLYDFNLNKNIELNFQLGTKTLQDFYLKTKYGLSLEKKIIMYKLVSCLLFIQSQGIIHCDLKPGNMIISEKGKVQIIDWGIAEIDYTINQTRNKEVTKQTLWYVAPELLQEVPKKDYSNKIDIFSLGLIFIELYIIRPFCKAYSRTNQRSNYIKLFFQENNEKLFSEKVKSLDNFQTIKKCLKKVIDDDLLLDLVSKMVDFNPDVRIGYEKIIEHEFFSELRVPKDAKKFVFINNMPIIKDINKNYDDRKKCIEFVYKIFKENKSDNYEVLFLTIQLMDLYSMKDEVNDVVCYGCFSISLKLFYQDYSVYKKYERYVLKKLEGSAVIPILYSYFSNNSGLKKCEKDILEKLEGDVIVPTLYSYNNSPEMSERIFEIYMKKDVYAKSFRKIKKI